MRIIFCCDPTNPRRPEPAYEREVDAAQRLGIAFDLVDHDALVAGELESVSRRAPAIGGPELSVFRGWMLTPDQYSALYGVLSTRGRALINTPDQYRRCHYLPESYDIIQKHTPRSV